MTHCEVIFGAKKMNMEKKVFNDGYKINILREKSVPVVNGINRNFNRLNTLNSQITTNNTHSICVVRFVEHNSFGNRFFFFK